MKRFYYTDPLAAAWMAKHFGMKFCDKTGLSVSADPSLWYMADRHYQAGSLFIHADSLHLLDIQEGDFVIGPNNKGGLEYVAGMKPSARCRIIQRDGKPFFWPEVEE